jgi:hypothetical protein
MGSLVMLAGHPQTHGLQEVVEILLGDLLHHLIAALLRQQSFLLPLSSPLPHRHTHTFLLNRCRLSFQGFLMRFSREGANAVLPCEVLGEEFVVGWVILLHGEIDATEVELLKGADGREGARGANVRQV